MPERPRLAVVPDEPSPMPSDEAAEQIVLGAMLTDASVIHAVTRLITAEDFHKPVHTTLFGAILTAIDQGTPAEPRALNAWLLDHGYAGKVNLPYLLELVEAVPTTANAPYYAGIVADRAQRRRLVEAAARVGQAAASPGRTTEELAQFAEEAILAARPQPQNQAVVRLSDLVYAGLDEIEARASRPKGRLTGTPTGLADLDRLTNGFQPGHLIVVAGRPAMGKSTLAVDAARAAAVRHGEPVLLCSLEMTNTEVLDRILAAEASVPLSLIRDGALDERDWTRLSDVAGRLSDAPLFLSEDRNCTVTRIEARARTIQARHGLSLLIVDYLQLIEGPRRRGDNREQEIAHNVRKLKALAGELKCPVIAVAQLNRSVEGRHDKRPMLSELRESGEIENAADLVLMLYRDEYYNKDTSVPGEVEIAVAKNRHGPQTTITAAAQLHMCRFMDLSTDTPPPLRAV